MLDCHVSLMQPQDLKVEESGKKKREREDLEMQ